MVQSDRLTIRNAPSDLLLYKPGGDGLDFVKMRIQYTAQAILSFSTKLVLALNEYLNDNTRATGIGVHGMFFLGKSAFHVLPGGTSYSHGLSGPAIFFAWFRRSEQERAQWTEANLVEKLRLSNYFFKHQRLDNSTPVLPIWTIRGATRGGDKNPNAGNHFISDVPVNRQSTWSKPERLGSLRGTDPSRLNGDGKTMGVWLDMLNSAAIVVPAESFRVRATSGGRNTGYFSEMNLRHAENPSRNGKWYKALQDPQGDQIEKIISYVGDYMKRHPDGLVTYQKARSWDNGLEYAELSGYISIKVKQRVKGSTKKSGDGGGGAGSSSKTPTAKTPKSHDQSTKRSTRSKASKGDDDNSGDSSGGSDDNGYDGTVSKGTKKTPSSKAGGTKNKSKDRNSKPSTSKADEGDEDSDEDADPISAILKARAGRTTGKAQGSDEARSASRGRPRGFGRGRGRSE